MKVYSCQIYLGETDLKQIGNPAPAESSNTLVQVQNDKFGKTVEPPFQKGFDEQNKFEQKSENKNNTYPWYYLGEPI